MTDIGPTTDEETAVAEHDWHVFDQLRNLEVRRVNGSYEVRPVGDTAGTVTMTEAEFEAFRTEEPPAEPEVEEDPDGDES